MSYQQDHIIFSSQLLICLTISLLALLNAGDEVLVEDPCFVSYHQLISFFAGVSVSVPMREENQFRWDKKELEAKKQKKIDH